MKILNSSLLTFSLLVKPGLSLLSDDRLLSLAKKGQLDSALSGSLERIAKHPQDAFAFLLVGKLSLDGEKALENFIKAAKYGNPVQAAEAKFKIAKFYFAKGNYSQAISSFRKLLMEHPKSQWTTQAQYWMGHACLNFGFLHKQYLDSANYHFVALLSRLSRNDYYYVMALDGLGRTRLEKNELDKAQETLEMALETAKSDQKPFLFYLAQALAMKSGNIKAAENWQRKLMSEFPYSLEGRKFALLNPPQLTGTNTEKTSEKGKFALQLGAFSTRNKALSALQSLKKSGIETHVFPKNAGAGTIFVLQTKVFNSRENAEKYAKSVLMTNGISYFIVEKN